MSWSFSPCVPAERGVKQGFVWERGRVGFFNALIEETEVVATPAQLFSQGLLYIPSLKEDA